MWVIEAIVMITIFLITVTTDDVIGVEIVIMIKKYHLNTNDHIDIHPVSKHLHTAKSQSNILHWLMCLLLLLCYLINN